MAYCLFIEKGIHSLFGFFSDNYSNKELENISTALLEKCKHTRLFLNCQVTNIRYLKSNSALNELVYTKNNRNLAKNYDYVIIAFPLTKVIKKHFKLISLSIFLKVYKSFKISLSYNKRLFNPI